MFSAGGFGFVLLVIVATVVILIVATRATRRDGAPTTVVSATLSIAAFWAALSVIGGLITFLVALLQPQMTLTVPVQDFWPQLPSGVEMQGAEASFQNGSFTTAMVTADGLSTSVHVLSALSQLLGWLVPGAVAALIAVACFQLLRGRTFAPVVARMATVTAVVVLVGGVAAQVLGDVAGSIASQEIFTWVGSTTPDLSAQGIEDVLQAWWPSPHLSITFPLWPVGAALAFAALAAIFRHGGRLEKDMEGLV